VIGTAIVVNKIRAMRDDRSSESLRAILKYVWIIPRATPNRDQISPYLYRARNLIQRLFNKIKQCRRIATRYDKLAAKSLAFIKLASIRIWLRANESSP
jgi:transposase